MNSEKHTGNPSGDGLDDDTKRVNSAQELSEIPPKYAVSIVVRKGNKKGAEYSITNSRTVIGRGTGADIIIDDPTVSRIHAAIEFCKNKFILKDLGSTNGTFVDGTSIKQADLAHGVLFQIGGTVMEFALAERPGQSVYVIE